MTRDITIRDTAEAIRRLGKNVAAWNAASAREIAANAREALETITVDAPQPRRLPPHRVERSTSPFPYVTPDEHWEMREAITRVLSAWYSTACVGGNSDAEAARITIEELTPYRIESAGNADAEVPDA